MEAGHTFGSAPWCMRRRRRRKKLLTRNEYVPVRRPSPYPVRSFVHTQKDAAQYTNVVKDTEQRSSSIVCSIGAERGLALKSKTTRTQRIRVGLDAETLRQHARHQQPTQLQCSWRPSRTFARRTTASVRAKTPIGR